VNTPPIGAPSGLPPGADRVLAARPEFFALERAEEHLALGKHELLHAGPPLADPAAPCTPILNSAIAACLLEGWADTPDQARTLVRDGKIRFRPAQDLGCVVPLADVLSASMWVQIVRDATALKSVACSPLNAGAVAAMRVGVWEDSVLVQLRWLRDTLGPVLRAALTEPLPLIHLADHGLAEGDDCHGKTAAASAALAALLHARLTGPDANACRNFLAQSAGFFLNLWMAASRCMLSAAVPSADSSLVTAAGGNGTYFGIQVAGAPGRWFVVPAAAPEMPGTAPDSAAMSLGAIGDSAIVDLLGFGAMTTLAPALQQPAGFVALWPDEQDMPRTVLLAEHPAFGRTAARVLVDARQVAASGRRPIVSLGVLDATGHQGRLGGGFYRTPSAIFEKAVAGLAADA